MPGFQCRCSSRCPRFQTASTRNEKLLPRLYYAKRDGLLNLASYCRAFIETLPFLGHSVATSVGANNQGRARSWVGTVH